MAISFIGSATGTTSVTLPAHQVGDLFILFMATNGANPATPAGWTTIDSVFTSDPRYRCAYIFATTTSTANPSPMTNSNAAIVLHYRGVQSVAFAQRNGGISATAGYDATTATSLNSWFAVFGVAASTSTTIDGAATGYTTRTNRAGSAVEVTAKDTNGIAASVASATTALGSSIGWKTSNIELIGIPPPSVTLDITSSTTATMSKIASSLQSIALGAAASFARAVSKSFSVSATSSATASPSASFLRALSLAVASSTSLAKSVGLIATTAISVVASVAKRVGKPLNMSSAVATVLTTLSAIPVLISATVSSASSVSRAIGKGVSLTAGGAVAVVKGVAAAVSAGAAATVAAAQLKTLGVVLAAAVSSGAGVGKSIAKGVAAAVAGTVALAASAFLNWFPMKVYRSGVWVVGKLRIYRDGQWVKPDVKRYTGGAWESMD